MSTLLEALNADEFLFVAIPESEEARNQPTRVFYGSLRTYNRQLKYFNSKGYGIFVTINRTLGNRRKEEDIVGYRAIFQDDDKGYTGGYPLEPGLVVNTSPGKYQRYWFIKSGEGPKKDDWKDVQHLMVKYGNDPSVCDPPRVLRLPGFYHMKGGYAGRFLVTETGDGRAYPWDELRRAFEDGMAKKEKPPAEEQKSEASPLSQHIQRVLSGENYNNALCSICMIQANAGIDRDSIKLFCEALMNAGKGPRDQRWHDRFAHIGIYVNTAFEKTDGKSETYFADDTNEELMIEKEQDMDESIEWPPGLMGDLAKNALEYAPTPNKTTAIVAALGLVAGICGRRYNISGVGLNLYLTLIMDTGMGKDAIHGFITDTLNHFNETYKSRKFLGRPYYTGRKPLLDHLQQQRSMVCVFTEAGFMLRSGSGDQDGLQKAFLILWNKSGRSGFYNGEAYSDSSKNILPIQAPALTIVNEATPVTLVEEYNKRQSIATGELPRMHVFRIFEKRQYTNEKHKFALGKSVQERLTMLLRDCEASSTEFIPKVIDIDFPEGFAAFDIHCTDIYNEFIKTKVRYAAMHSRAALKALKIAALISVFNTGLTGGKEEKVSISDEAWDWALQLHNYEMRGLDDVFLIDTQASLDDVVQRVVMPVIVKLIKGEYKIGVKKIFSYNNIYQQVKFNSMLAMFGDTRNNTTGLMKALNHMQATGLIEQARGERQKGRLVTLYRITNEFNKLWNENNRSILD